MSNRPLPEGVKRRVSEKKKEASNFKRQRDLAEYYDNYNGIGKFRDAAFIKKGLLNYDLMNGRLDVDEYIAPMSTTIQGERVDLPQYEIIHNPITSQVANAMLGEQIIRPFRPQAVEMGTSYQNAYKKTVTELMREHLTQNIIMPAQQRAQGQWMQENGVTDPYTLDIEQQQQMRSDVDQRTKAMTPKEVADFMRNDFQTATQRQAQQLIKYLTAELGLREMSNEGFKHAIVTGREYYGIEDRNGDPIMRLLNPLYFQWGGDQNEEWVQNGEWAKYEEWRTFTSIISDYGEHFKRGDWKKLEEFAEPIGGFDHLGDIRHDPTMRRAMYMLTEENGYVAELMSDVDMRTGKGQQSYIGLLNSLSNRWGTTYDGVGFGIREATVTFRDNREMFEVIRLVNGKKEKYWRADHYTATKEDIAVYSHWVPDIWEAKILGSFEPIITKVRRVPNQHRSIHDPRKVLLPFVGREYSSPMNNSKGVSPIDLAKAAQKDYDVLKTEIRRDMATDNGKVFAMVTKLKPDNMTWTEFYTQMKVFKTVHLQTDKHGMMPTDASILKSIDMSNTSALTQKLAMLEAARIELIQAMYFNPTRMGMGGQYANVDVTKNNRAASFNQTEAFFDSHNQIFSKAMVQLINRARYVLKDQPHKLDMIFDDVARANLELTHNIWNAELGVDISLRNSDIEAIETLRTNLQALIQNSMSMQGIVDLALAETTSDIRALFQREARQLEERQKMEMEAAQKQLETKEQSRLQEKQMELDGKLKLKEQEAAASLERTKVQVTQFQLQADVDQNKVADSITKAEMEIAAKERIAKADRELEREKITAEKEKSKYR